MNGAVVEIIDPTSTDGSLLVPQRVLINGVDVGFISTDGVAIQVGGKVGDRIDTTTVTLTLMPSRVVIRGSEPTDSEPTYLNGLRAQSADVD